jgi:hypothetical protein
MPRKYRQETGRQGFFIIQPRPRRLIGRRLHAGQARGVSRRVNAPAKEFIVLRWHPL